jgi:hypothetical protein
MTLATWAVALLLAAGTDAPAAASPPPPPPPPPPPAAAAPAKPPAPPAPTKDPRALALVQKMSDRLRLAGTFTFKARVALELPAGGGALATFFNDATVAVQRPDKVLAVRSGDLPEIRFAYDGRSMTIYAPGNGQWGSTAAPPTLGAMLLAAAEQGGLSFPFDEVLVADPYAVLIRDLTQATLVGQTTLAGRKTDHVLLASPGLELQLWLDAVTALPIRVAVVYADDPIRPHFSVDYADWMLDAKLPASTFALPRPPSATQVEFRAAADSFR